MKNKISKISIISGLLITGCLLQSQNFVQAAKPINQPGKIKYNQTIVGAMGRPDLTVKVNWYSEFFGKIIVANAGKRMAQPSVLKLKCTGGWGKGDRDEWKIRRCLFPGFRSTQFFNVPALRPGGEYVISARVTQFEGRRCDKSNYLYGNRYTISAYIDANYRIREMRENNNYAYQKKQLVCGITFLKNRKNRKTRKPSQRLR